MRAFAVQSRKPDTQRAAEILKLFCEGFEKDSGLSLSLIAQDVDTITTRGTAADAVVALAAVPVEEHYAQIRMTLLCRILKRSASEPVTAWYQQKFVDCEFLPEEYKIIVRHFTTDPAIIEELLETDLRRPQFTVIQGGLH